MLDLIDPLETMKLACRSENVALVDTLLFHSLWMPLSILNQENGKTVEEPAPQT